MRVLVDADSSLPIIIETVVPARMSVGSALAYADRIAGTSPDLADEVRLAVEQHQRATSKATA